MKSTKKFLQQYEHATLELEALAEEKERLMSVLLSLTSNLSDEPIGTSSSDKIGDNVSELVDLVRNIDESVKYYITVRDDVLSVIRAVMHEDINLGKSLHYRYRMFMTPCETAFNMGYSEQSERRFHYAALMKASEIIKAKKLSEHER